MGQFKNPDAFAAAVMNDMRSIDRRTKRAIKGAADTAFERAQRASRVRTGSFKANWEFAYGQMPNPDFRDLRQMRRKPENLRLADLKIRNFTADQAYDGENLFMVNPSPYGPYLERKDGYTMIAADQFWGELFRRLEKFL